MINAYMSNHIRVYLPKEDVIIVANAAIENHIPILGSTQHEHSTAKTKNFRLIEKLVESASKDHTFKSL